MERDQIISLVFLNGSDRDSLIHKLSSMKNVFEMDTDYCLFTIGVSPMFDHSSDLLTAYEEAFQYTKSRRLNTRAQIITEPSKPSDYRISLQQEHDLNAHLLSLNKEAAVQWVHRILKQIEANEVLAEKINEFTHYLWRKTSALLHSQKLDQQPLDTIVSEINFCYSMDEYEELLTRLFHQAIDMLQSKKEEQNSLVDFVTAYLEEHYKEDVSLDRLAERLKLSPGHLSAYFKEKSGYNFKDYLTQIRINKAKELLIRTDNKIQDIAEMVGYLNLTPFIRMFRKHTGMTPGEYRKQIDKHVI